MDNCLGTLGISSPLSLLVGGRKRSIVLEANHFNQLLVAPSCLTNLSVSPESGNGNREGRKLIQHRDSLDMVLNKALDLAGSALLVSSSSNSNNHIKTLSSSDDDDTCSTATATTDSSLEQYHLEASDECSSSSSSPTISPVKHVHWATQVIAEVRFRPYTARKDKYHLFYNEFDYMDFKIDYVTGRQRPKKVVSFALTHDVKPIPIVSSKQERSKLYYSESELQHFLDDFVVSLSQTMSP